MDRRATSPRAGPGCRAGPGPFFRLRPAEQPPHPPLPRLGITWPVALDPEMRIWRDYEPHGWPALFLWARGGALRWYHLGEGEYAGTEEAVREALEEAGAEREWPPTVEALRPSDVPGMEVIAPTPEQFPGGSTEEPWVA